MLSCNPAMRRVLSVVEFHISRSRKDIFIQDPLAQVWCFHRQFVDNRLVSPNVCLVSNECLQQVHNNPSYSSYVTLFIRQLVQIPDMASAHDSEV